MIEVFSSLEERELHLAHLLRDRQLAQAAISHQRSAADGMPEPVPPAYAGSRISVQPVAHESMPARSRDLVSRTKLLRSGAWGEVH